MEVSEAELAELSKLLHRLSEKRELKDTNEDLQREADRHLETIRDSFKPILKCGKHDVFAQYLIEQLETFATICVDASRKSVLRVTEHCFKNAQNLLSAFGGSERVVRYTWKIAPGQRLFDDEVWRNYFELSSSLAISGAMEIRAMLIMQDQRAIETANVGKLLEFFASEENLTAKIVLSGDWEACMVDHAIPQACLEFGIFGANLLYQANTYTPVSVGRWCKDGIEIGRYMRFFDALWNMPGIAAQNPASRSQKVRLSELMAVDSLVERRHNAVHDQQHNAVHDQMSRIEEKIKAEVA